MHVETTLCSSLDKVFPDECPTRGKKLLSGSALRGERFAFQLAAFLQDESRVCLTLEIRSELAEHINTYAVGYAPSLLPAYFDHDDNYLRTVPGLFPDILRPCNGQWQIIWNQWQSLWFDIAVPQDIDGVYPITVLLKYPDGTLAAEHTFTLEVIPASLPAQTLKYTQWFHCDCIATAHRVPVFSEEHWALMETYMRNAAEYGVNMILTPIFTPPLDTAPGSERPTVQLVEISVAHGVYHFGFDLLSRYIDMAQRAGIAYFEISHLFTQWGAAHAPKIMANVDGGYRRLFGWETDAQSPEYIKFLHTFIPALREFLQEQGVADRCYFHISDEPNKENQHQYKRSRDSIIKALDGCRVMDALSEVEFFDKGLVSIPVPPNDNIEPFLSRVLPERWTYYCCGQHRDVSNRFFAMPSARNRILGLQLYRYEIEGFLQWGYNFWYAQHSTHAIDPYAVTDAEGAYQSGDAFSVYPGENGPISSLRQHVFLHALQDQQACVLLESFMGRPALSRWIDNQCQGALTFQDYPKDASSLLNIRNQINNLIKQYALKN